MLVGNLLGSLSKTEAHIETRIFQGSCYVMDFLNIKNNFWRPSLIYIEAFSKQGLPTTFNLSQFVCTYVNLDIEYYGHFSM